MRTSKAIAPVIDKSVQFQRSNGSHQYPGIKRAKASISPHPKNPRLLTAYAVLIADDEANGDGIIDRVRVISFVIADAGELRPEHGWQHTDIHDGEWIQEEDE